MVSCHPFVSHAFALIQLLGVSPQHAGSGLSTAQLHVRRRCMNDMHAETSSCVTETSLCADGPGLVYHVGRTCRL